MRTRTLALFVALTTVIAFAPACKHGGNGSSGAVDNSATRKERVLENLKAQYPRLADMKPTLGDFKRVSPGMDEVSMSVPTPRGEQKQLLLVTADNKTAYLVIEGPIDISKDAAALKAEQAKQSADRKNELAQAAQNNPERGNPRAPVTIVEFSDFQCPFCRRAATTMDELLKKYPNDVKLVYMNYPLPFHAWAKSAAVAAVCAAKQDPTSFWKLHDAFFTNQEQINPGNVLDKTRQFLQGTKVNLDEWQKCAKDDNSAEHKSAAENVEATLAMGNKLGVEGTPAFFVNGQFVDGALPLDHFERLVEQALKQKT